MREIKFRAWDKKTKKFMLPWPEGFYLFGETTCFDLMGQQFEKGEDRLLRYNDLEIMQYTGLKDKNGKEIFEGDIIEGMHNFGPGGFSKRRGIVEWKGDGYSMNYWEDFEVIGNIYENPELVSEQVPALQ